jgi:hypothetical protein
LEYFQPITVEYLRADRAIFVNTEFCLQLNEGLPAASAHWFVDALAVDFRSKTIFLCETSFEKSMASIVERLQKWQTNWTAIPKALARDSALDVGLLSWPIRAWLFVPQDCLRILLKKLAVVTAASSDGFPPPRITTLEMTQPWQYCSWNREGEGQKPTIIPHEMQI